MLAALSNALLRPSKISFQQIAFHTSQRTEHRTDAPLVCILCRNTSGGRTCPTGTGRGLLGDDWLARMDESSRRINGLPRELRHNINVTHHAGVVHFSTPLALVQFPPVNPATAYRHRSVQLISA